VKIGEIYNEIFEESGERVFYHGSPYQFDKFDFDRIGSGDGLAKFGYGLYFTDNPDLAIYYAKELSKGELKKTGFNLYTVKLYNLDEFYVWEEETPEFVAQCVVRKLLKLGKTSDAELITTEYEEYGKYWELKNMYSVLTDILGTQKETSEWLTICGVGGVISDAITHSGKIYTVYDDSLIKIVNVENLR
jgi:hypothetical protein